MKTLTLKNNLVLKVAEESENTEFYEKSDMVIVHIEGCKTLRNDQDGYALPKWIFKEFTK